MKLTEGASWGAAAGRANAAPPARNEDAVRRAERQAAENVPSDQIAPLRQHEMVSSALHADSTEREARIEQLSGLVRSGSYRVDAIDISRALVREALA
jgi:anti-sigma28 factor (negative regulator of flagellin synthesis)